MATLQELFKRAGVHFVHLCGVFDSSGNPAGNVVVRNAGDAPQSHNRLIATGGSTLPTNIATALWGADEKVTRCRFKVTGGTAGHRARIVFDATPVDDATDTVTANNWLQAAVASVANDVEYFEIAQGADFTAAAGGGEGEWSRWFDFGAYLRRVDAISVDADVVQNIFIEAE